MDTKGSSSPSTTNLNTVPLTEEGIAYIAIKGSLHASDCSAFGLLDEEISALTKKYPGSGLVVNGITMKTNVLHGMNSLAQLGYKIVSSTGENEITWTMQREIIEMDHTGCDHTNCTIVNQSVCQTISEMDWERGIWNAAFNGEKEKVITLIDKAKNAKELVNTPDNSGYTALHYASRNGHIDICKTLLQNGAHIDSQTNGLATPLHKAAAAGKSTTVEYLLQSGASATMQDIDGQTALHKATANKHSELITILLEACPELVSIKDKRGRVASEFK